MAQAVGRGDAWGAEATRAWFCGCYSFTKAAALRWAEGSGWNDWGRAVVAPSAEDRVLLLYDARVAGGQAAMKLEVEEGTTKRGMCMSLSLVSPTDAAGLAFPSVVAGWEGGQVSVLDLRSGGQLAFEAQVTDNATPILALDIAKDGQSAIVGTSGEDITMVSIDYATQTMSSRTFFTCNQGGISAVRFRPDQRIVATAGWDHRIRIFHRRTRKPLAILKYHDASVFGIDFTPDNNFLVSASKDHKIALWSIYPPDADAAKQALRAY